MLSALRLRVRNLQPSRRHVPGSWRARFRFSACIGTMNLALKGRHRQGAAGILPAALWGSWRACSALRPGVGTLNCSSSCSFLDLDWGVFSRTRTKRRFNENPVSLLLVILVLLSTLRLRLRLGSRVRNILPSGRQVPRFMERTLELCGRVGVLATGPAIIDSTPGAGRVADRLVGFAGSGAVRILQDTRIE